MPNFLKHEVVAEILKVGLVPVFYNRDMSVTKKIIQACAQGGATVIEFTNRGDYAHEIFSDVSKWSQKELPQVILGVGTVLDPATAGLYINNGANFVVGPVFNPDVAKICNRRKVTYIPGCMTPTEISEAEEMGVDIVKVFPGNIVGSKFIKAIRGPCPWLKLMPSGGVEVTRENISDWITAGAVALNIGSNLIKKDFIKTGDFNGIQKLVEQCISWIKEARKEGTASP